MDFFGIQLRDIVFGGNRGGSFHVPHTIVDANAKNAAVHCEKFLKTYPKTSNQTSEDSLKWKK
jgi:hypothetical protein